MKTNSHYWRRGLAVWGIVIWAESLHGTARELWLKPLVGDFRARQIAFFLGMALILVIAWLSYDGYTQRADVRFGKPNSNTSELVKR